MLVFIYFTFCRYSRLINGTVGQRSLINLFFQQRYPTDLTNVSKYISFKTPTMTFILIFKSQIELGKISASPFLHPALKFEERWEKILRFISPHTVKLTVPRFISPKTVKLTVPRKNKAKQTKQKTCSIYFVPMLTQIQKLEPPIKEV